MKKYLYRLLILGTVVTTANATCGTASCWLATVTTLIATSSGDVLVATDGDESSLNCTAPGNIYLTLKANTTVQSLGANAIYSTLLSAQITKAKIGIRIIENSSTCEIAYVTIK